MGFDVGGVHVGVEEDHGEGQDEDGVWVVELLHHVWITHAVSLAAREEAFHKIRGREKKKTAFRAKAKSSLGSTKTNKIMDETPHEKSAFQN